MRTEADRSRGGRDGLGSAPEDGIGATRLVRSHPLAEVLAARGDVQPA